MWWIYVYDILFYDNVILWNHMCIDCTTLRDEFQVGLYG
jgi:hypothetical protein